MFSGIDKKLAIQADEFQLCRGNHATPEEGMCAMEVVAYLDGSPHSDRPRRTSEAITEFVRHLNDHLPDDLRPRLLPFLPRLVGTVSEEYEQQRIEYFAWQTIRVFAPAGLNAQGYRRFATVLKNSPTFQDAKQIAETVRRGISRREGGKVWGKQFSGTWSPVDLAVHRAYRADASAAFSASHGRELGFWDEILVLRQSGRQAAFQAHLAGCNDAWEHAFVTLEAVLAIGMPNQRTAPAARTSGTASFEKSDLNLHDRRGNSLCAG